MSDRKSTDDVQQLLKDRRLDDLQYREFSPPQAANLTLAGSRNKTPTANLPVGTAVPPKPEPVATLPETIAASRNAPAVDLPSPARGNAGHEPRPAAPRAAVHESPLNFTFERLRRQVIPARANGPLLDLNFAPRHRAAATPRLELLQQRTMADVFNSLLRATGTRRHGS